MADIVSKAKRSWIMSRIRSHWTKIDKKMHGLLKANKTMHSMYPAIDGKPDIFVPPKTLVFLDGCFWHGCPKCGRPPKSKLSYWRPKIKANIRRDRSVRARLRNQGWTVLRFWEHQVLSDGRKCADAILQTYRRPVNKNSLLHALKVVKVPRTRLRRGHRS